MIAVKSCFAGVVPKTSNNFTTDSIIASRFTGVVEDGCDLFPTNMKVFEHIKEYLHRSHPPPKDVVCAVQINANAHNHPSDKDYIAVNYSDCDAEIRQL